MAQENVQIISNLYEAFARRDMQTILAAIDPQIEVTQTTALPWGGRYNGHQGIMDFAARLLQHVDSRVDVAELVEAGERIIMLGHTRGRVRSNNKEFDVRAVHIWTMKDGKALRFEAYIDTPKMLQALNG